MRALLFCWEYPPRIVGKLSQYVSDLAAELVRSKVETHVVTFHDTLTGETKDSNGVSVFRVSNPVRTHVSLITWDLTVNEEVERAAASIYYQTGKQIDVINVFDWHFIPAAATLKHALGIPFVYSVDSLEDHRSPGANAPLNMAIRGIEWLGFYESNAVLANSEWMQSEITRIYKVPKEKIIVLPATTEAVAKTLVKTYRSIARGAAK